MARDLAAAIGRAGGEATFLAEFQLYALSDPEIGTGFAASYADAFTHTAAYLANLKGGSPAMPPRPLAVALQAIALGFMVQSFITPGEITEAVITATLRVLADGLAARSRSLDSGGAADE